MEEDDEEVRFPASSKTTKKKSLNESMTPLNQAKMEAQNAFERDLCTTTMGDSNTLMELILTLKGVNQISSSALLRRMQSWLFNQKLISQDVKDLRCPVLYEHLEVLCRATKDLDNEKWKDFIVNIGFNKSKLQGLYPPSDLQQNFSDASHSIALMCTAIMDPDISLLMTRVHNSLPPSEAREILDGGVTLYREQLWEDIKDSCNRLAHDGLLLNKLSNYPKLVGLNPK